MIEAGPAAPGARVHVVPHTHWDREWYLPFAVFRRRLVALMDTLLDTLAAEPAFRFHLDGQLAVVDDYLEVRPWRAAELRAAAEAGRVSIGPWYTLPDEHLVSGECILRNLELGRERARHFAPRARPMAVGYVPDQFGHTAQLPQILRRFGIDVAVLWRGVPAEVTSSSSAGRRWTAPRSTLFTCAVGTGTVARCRWQGPTWPSAWARRWNGSASATPPDRGS